MGSYSNSKDQISLEEAYKAVHNEDFHSVYQGLRDIGAQLPPESSLKYAMQTLLATAAGGLLGAALGHAAQQLSQKFKKVLSRNKDIENTEISPELKNDLKSLKKNKDNLTGEKVLAKLENEINKAVESHVDNVGNKFNQ
jgi:hypothetical protein